MVRLLFESGKEKRVIPGPGLESLCPAKKANDPPKSRSRYTAPTTIKNF
jgi:hypothetical protein